MSAPVAQPVFVCGLGRSGTSWVCDALGQSPELAYIEEAWLLEKLEELVDWFAMLHDEWADFTPWRRRGIDRAAFVASLAGWYRALLERAAGGRRFVEKTPDWNAQRLPFLHELFPDAHYVLVHRDGRNQVSSLEAMKGAQGEPFDFAAACRRWGEAMDVFARIRDTGSVRHLIVIRYEDLLEDLDASFRRLCSFVGIRAFAPEPFAPNSQFGPARSAADFNTRWHAWSPERRDVFRREAGRQLVEWGYAVSGERW